MHSLPTMTSLCRPALACGRTKIHDYVRHLFDVHALKEASVKRHPRHAALVLPLVRGNRGEIENTFRGARIQLLGS